MIKIKPNKKYIFKDNLYCPEGALALSGDKYISNSEGYLRIGKYLIDKISDKYIKLIN